MQDRLNTGAIAAAIGAFLAGAFFLDWWTHFQLAGKTITVEPYDWYIALLWIVPLAGAIWSIRRG